MVVVVSNPSGHQKLSQIPRSLFVGVSGRTAHALLVLLAASDLDVSLRDMAVDIISGNEVLITRFFSQAQTWVPQFPEVHVDSDFFPNTSKSDISAASPRSKIHFVEIPNVAQHLIGSQWEQPWYHAQPRFLPGMDHLWKHNPKATWYVVGDDDT
jgi:hypothetical protein